MAIDGNHDRSADDGLAWGNRHRIELVGIVAIHVNHLQAEGRVGQHSPRCWEPSINTYRMVLVTRREGVAIEVKIDTFRLVRSKGADVELSRLTTAKFNNRPAKSTDRHPQICVRYSI